MIPAILISAYAICLTNMMPKAVLYDAGSSYRAGYEQCALIVPHVERLMDAEYNPQKVVVAANNAAVLKAALAEIAGVRVGP